MADSPDGYDTVELPPHDKVDASAAERTIIEVFFVLDMVLVFYTQRHALPIATRPLRAKSERPRAETAFDRLARGPGFGYEFERCPTHRAGLPKHWLHLARTTPST